MTTNPLADWTIKAESIARVVAMLPLFSEGFLAGMADQLEIELSGKRPPQRTDGPSLRLTRVDGERPA